MRQTQARAGDLGTTFRVDAKYHVSRVNPLMQELNTGPWEFETVANLLPEARIWSGNIFSRVYTTDAALGRPLLVPYDLFRYTPWSDKILSQSQTLQFEQLKVKRGTAHVICSGRNLGPITIADRFTEQFCMSHDIIRIEPPALTEDFFYVVGFLSTRHGQMAIRTDMNGSVIDHANEQRIAAVRVPLMPQSLRREVARLFRRAFKKREVARLRLAAAQVAYDQMFGLSEFAKFRSPKFGRRFEVSRSSVLDRFDAESLAPQYRAARDAVAASGGVRLDTIADVGKPASRYKTNYVEDAQHGIVLLNGRQIAQYRPIAVKLMNLAAFKDADVFKLKKGTTLVTADGRAEENLADCAMVTEERVGWGASGHVHRVVPREGVLPGLVYLACASTAVQAQLKAFATGSVVDALSEGDLKSVLVPYAITPESKALARFAERAWLQFGEAYTLEEEAKGLLEQAFSAKAVLAA